MAERYKLGDIDNERFYQVPKSLFINPRYKGMSNTSKMLYAILKDRMDLSRKNGWSDENGDIFLLFDQQELADLLTTSRITINRNMKDLKDAGLLEPVRQGLGKPNKLYIRKPEPYIHQDVSEMLHSDVSKMLHLNVKKFNSNDTDISDTEKSDTERGAKPPKSKRKAFTPPLFEEVLAYVMDKGLNVDAKRFFDYYEAGDWHDAKGKPVKNWKQKCITWDKHSPSQSNNASTKAVHKEVTMSPEEYRRQQEELEAKARAELMKLGE